MGAGASLARALFTALLLCMLIGEAAAQPCNCNLECGDALSTPTDNDRVVKARLAGNTLGGNQWCGSVSEGDRPGWETRCANSYVVTGYKGADGTTDCAEASGRLAACTKEVLGGASRTAGSPFACTPPSLTLPRLPPCRW